LFNLILFFFELFYNKYSKDLVLEQKKEDSVLIRAGKYEDSTQKYNATKSKAWHDPCHIPHGRVMSQNALLLFLLYGQATY